MKKLYLLFFCICSVTTLAAQLPVVITNHLGEEYVSLNFILVRNSEVFIPSWRDELNIMATDSIGEKVIFKNLSYEPGNLLIKKSEYDALQEMSDYELYFNIKHKNAYRRDYSYVIPLTKNWFKFNYVVVEVSDRRKWVFCPLNKAREYTYQIITHALRPIEVWTNTLE